MQSGAAGASDSPAAGPFDAIVLAGGRASRLGGRDKPALVFRGEALLDHAITAAAGAGAAVVVVVGPERPRDGHRPLDLAPGEPDHSPPSARVRWAIESPRFGGPAAALGAGMGILTAPDRAGAPGEWVLVLAADLPFAREAVPALLAALHDACAVDAATLDGVIAVDADGRDQPLLGVYRAESLGAALAVYDDLAGMPLRRVIGPLVLGRRTLGGRLTVDVDEPADAAALGIALGEAPGTSPGTAP